MPEWFNKRTAREAAWFLACLMIAAFIYVMTGCKTVGRIKTAAGIVQGPKDANGVSLASGASTATMTLPAGSRLTTVKWQPVLWQPAINGKPEVAAQPAREETTVVLSKDAAWRKDESTVVADTGVIDTTVALKRIDVAERRWLLWAAIGCGVAGLVCKASFPAWPTISNGLLMAAVAAGAAWKMSEIPAYAWLAVLGVAVLIVMGYKRREKDEREEKAAAANPAAPTP